MIINNFTANVGKWRNSHCNVHNHFICAKNKGVTDPIVTPRPTPLPGGCPNNFITFESKCFRFVDERESWGSAQQKCTQDNNAVLATISDVYDQCEY